MTATLATTVQDGPVTGFVVLFEGRSGSTHLMETLEGHPLLDVDFEPLARFSERARTASAVDRARFAKQQLETARAGLTSPNRQCSALGLKVKLRDVLEPIAFAALLRELEIRVILLQRRNLVKWTVSYINAQRLHQETGDWNLYDEASRMGAFAVDPESFDGWLEKGRERHERLRDFALSLELPLLEVDYEDLLVDREATLMKVFTFIGVRYERSSGRSLKHTSDDLRDVLSNFDTLRAHYEETVYGPMFDEILDAEAST
jgi:LPS sulfotransferase NodH